MPVQERTAVSRSTCQSTPSLSRGDAFGVRLTAVAPVFDDSISKAPERIAGMFDAIAPRYDLLNHLLSGGIDRTWRTRAIRSLALTGRERVLDLCTGTADLAIAASAARPAAARVVGVDFAGAMLQVGRAKIARTRLGG